MLEVVSLITAVGKVAKMGNIWKHVACSSQRNGFPVPAFNRLTSYNYESKPKLVVSACVSRSANFYYQADFHCHLHNGATMELVTLRTSRDCDTILVMLNLQELIYETLQPFLILYMSNRVFYHNYIISTKTF